MRQKTNSALKRIYTTVFSQVFSPCGGYLAVCDNYGSLTIFHIPDTTTQTLHSPYYQLDVFDGPAYSLVSTDKFLIIAGTGIIKAYDWSEIIAKNDQVAWSLNLPNGTNYDTPEVNKVAVNEDKLYAGCGDNLVHIWDLESGKLENSLKGHTDYVHDLTISNNRLVSAGEDGNIVIWDVRSLHEPHNIFQPWKNEKLSRPDKGKFIKCLSMDSDDWLVCGGGPKMSLWHLQSLSCTTVLETVSCPNFVSFYEDGLVSGGSLGKVEYWSMDGAVRAQVPCKPRNLFCLGQGRGAVTVAGSGAVIDVFTSLAYSAYSLKLR